MAQSDIFDLLKSKRVYSDDFFTAKQIYFMLRRDRGIDINLVQVSKNLAKLRQFGFLDWDYNTNTGSCHNRFSYRLKKSFV